ncbi:MAG: TetR/AcrR family transcriptional regulator [Kordiimonadaceae bacterium]|nr:TetR/AcrR family transcriptional regulator [Kordiimonadaceae bacterium]
MAPRPLGRRPRKTREEIYQAAIELFMERGAHSVTMQDIADHAETARSTVFNHYPSKNHLYEAFFKRFANAVLQAAKATNISGFRATMYVYFETMAIEAERYKAILRDIVGLTLGGGSLRETDLEIDTQMIDFISGLVQSGIESGEIGADLDVMETSGLLLGHITITNHDWVNQGQTTDLGDDHKARFELLFRGLKP